MQPVSAGSNDSRLLLLGSSTNLYMGIDGDEVIIVPDQDFRGTEFRLQGVDVTTNFLDVQFRVIGNSSNGTVKVDVESHNSNVESHNVESHNSNVESHNSSRPSWLVRLWRRWRPVHNQRNRR